MARRCAAAAKGITGEQLQLLEQQLPLSIEKAKDPSALAMHMAKLAGQGGLEVSRSSVQPSPSREGAAQARLCALAGRRLIEPRSRKQWLIEPGGHVRGESGILSPATAATLLEKLDKGELEVSDA